MLLIVGCTSMALPGPPGQATEARRQAEPVMVGPPYGGPDYLLAAGGGDVDGGWDFDGDGYLDVVTTGTTPTSPNPCIYYWNGAGFDGRGFTDSLETRWDSYAPIAFAGDVNGDGYADVVAGGGRRGPGVCVCGRARSAH